MKKIIAAAFALAVAGPLLGATAAQALSIGSIAALRFIIAYMMFEIAVV